MRNHIPAFPSRITELPCAPYPLSSPSHQSLPHRSTSLYLEGIDTLRRAVFNTTHGWELAGRPSAVLPPGDDAWRARPGSLRMLNLDSWQFNRASLDQGSACERSAHPCTPLDELCASCAPHGHCHTASVPPHTGFFMYMYRIRNQLGGDVSLHCPVATHARTDVIRYMAETPDATLTAVKCPMRLDERDTANRWLSEQKKARERPPSRLAHILSSAVPWKCDGGRPAACPEVDPKLLAEVATLLQGMSWGRRTIDLTRELLKRYRKDARGRRKGGKKKAAHGRRLRMRAPEKECPTGGESHGCSSVLSALAPLTAALNCTNLALSYWNVNGPPLSGHYERVSEGFRRAIQELKASPADYKPPVSAAVYILGLLKPKRAPKKPPPLLPYIEGLVPQALDPPLMLPRWRLASPEQRPFLSEDAQPGSYAWTWRQWWTTSSRPREGVHKP